MKPVSNSTKETKELRAASPEVDANAYVDPMEKRGLFQRVADFMFGFDFFISYCWADGRYYATELHRKLAGRGFNCFLDSSDYAKGDNWRAAGQRALKKTSRLILVGTPKAVLSEPVANELRIFSGLNRRIFPIDFGGALSATGSSEGIFRYLDRDMIRVHEADSALIDGPSEDLIQQIRASFNLLRQDQKRIRWFSGLAAVFAAVAAVAVVLFFVAEARKREAVQQTGIAQDQTKKAKHSASFTELLTAGRHQNDNLADEAVAYLCRSIRTDPSNQLAKDKLVATLATTGFVPILEQYRDPGSFGARNRANGFTTVAFSKNGARLLIADNNNMWQNQFSVWDVNSSSKPVEIPLGGEIQNLMVNPAGTRFLTEDRQLLTENGEPYFDIYRFPDPSDPLLQEFEVARVRSQELDDKLSGDLDKLESENPEKQTIERKKQEIEKGIEKLQEDVKKSLKIARISLPPSPSRKDGADEPEHYLIFSEGMMNERGEIVLLSGNAARVWRVETGKPISPVLKFEGPGTCQAISADGTVVVVGGSNGRLHLWRAPNWKEVAGSFHAEDLKGAKGPVRRVAISADGAVVTAAGPEYVNGDAAKFLWAWNVSTGEELSTEFHIKTAIQWMKPNRDGSAVLTWREGPGEAILSPIGSGETRRSVSFGEVSAISMDLRGEKFITASGRTAQIRDAVNGNPLSAVLNAPGDIMSVAFSPDGKRIALGTKNGFAGVWDWAGRTPVAPRYSWHGPSSDLIQNGKFAASVSAREVVVVDLETHQEKRLPHPEDVKFVRLARNGSVLAAGAGDAIFLWNPATGEKLADPLVVLSGKVLQDNSKDDFEKVALSGDGSRMIVVQKDDLKTTVWDLRKQSPPVPRTLEDQSFRDFSGNGRVTPEVELSENGMRAMVSLTLKYGAQVLVFDLESRDVLYSKSKTRKSDESPDDQARLSADGKKLAWWEDNSVHLIDVDSKRDIIKPISLDDMVTTVAFGSKDGQLVTGAKDGTVIIWNTAKGNHSQPMRHASRVECIAMTQDGTRIVTATVDGKLRVWDVASGEALTAPISCPGSLQAIIDSVGFSLDGSNVFVHSTLYSESAAEESLSVWEIPRWDEAQIPEWFLKMAEAIGGRWINESGLPQDITPEESRKIRKSALSQEGGGIGLDLARKLLAPEAKGEASIAPVALIPARAPTLKTPAPSDDPRIKDFLDAWIAAGNSGPRAVAQADYYADPAQINGVPTTRNKLIADQMAFEKTFPNRAFAYMDHKILTSDPAQSITLTVRQHVVLGKPSGAKREMDIQDELDLRPIDGKLKIESCKRLDSKVTP